MNPCSNVTHEHTHAESCDDTNQDLLPQGCGLPGLHTTDVDSRDTVTCYSRFCHDRALDAFGMRGSRTEGPVIDVYAMDEVPEPL